jgi:protein O-mannosyl-transferase
LLAAVGLTLFLGLFKQRWTKPCFLAWLFFCVSLVPVMGWTDVGFMKFSLVADHYLHIAVIAVVVLAAAGIHIWRNSSKEVAKPLAAVAPFFIVAAFGMLTFQRNGDFSSGIAVYEDTLKKNPDCWLACDNLGELYLDNNRNQEAKTLLEKAIQLKPDYADAHNNLGRLYDNLGNLSKAIRHFQLSIQYQDTPSAHRYLGNTLEKAGRIEDAIQEYENALKLDKYSLPAYNNLALAYKKINKRDEALAAAEKALEIARSSSQQNLADKIEAWIKAYPPKSP